MELKTNCQNKSMSGASAFILTNQSKAKQSIKSLHWVFYCMQLSIFLFLINNNTLLCTPAAAGAVP